MPIHRPSEGAPALILAAILLVGLPGPASALGHRHRPGRREAPPAGYAVPIQDVFQYPAAIVNQPTYPFGYAAPIQDVFQYPAAIVNQPGALPPAAAPAPWRAGDMYHVPPR